jgi:hypothetical protein
LPAGFLAGEPKFGLTEDACRAACVFPEKSLFDRWKRIGSGGPYGLQNRGPAVMPPAVGSIPTPSVFYWGPAAKGCTIRDRKNKIKPWCDVMTVDFVEQGRALQIEAEKRRKRGDLVEAGQMIGEAAVCYLKAICAVENIPCATAPEYFTAAGELARRLRSQNINKQFAMAILLMLNGQAAIAPSDLGGIITLTGDQIKTYFLV